MLVVVIKSSDKTKQKFKKEMKLQQRIKDRKNDSFMSYSPLHSPPSPFEMHPKRNPSVSF